MARSQSNDSQQNNPYFNRRQHVFLSMQDCRAARFRLIRKTGGCVDSVEKQTKSRREQKVSDSKIHGYCTQTAREVQSKPPNTGTVRVQKGLCIRRLHEEKSLSWDTMFSFEKLLSSTNGSTHRKYAVQCQTIVMFGCWNFNCN